MSVADGLVIRDPNIFYPPTIRANPADIFDEKTAVPTVD